MRRYTFINVGRGVDINIEEGIAVVFKMGVQLHHLASPEGTLVVSLLGLSRPSESMVIQKVFLSTFCVLQ